MRLENVVQYYIAKTETKEESEIPNYLKAHSEDLRQFLETDEVQAALQEYLKVYPRDTATEKMHNMEPFLQLHREHFRTTIQ